MRLLSHTNAQFGLSYFFAVLVVVVVVVISSNIVAHKSAAISHGSHFPLFLPFFLSFRFFFFSFSKYRASIRASGGIRLRAQSFIYLKYWGKCCATFRFELGKRGAFSRYAFAASIAAVTPLCCITETYQLRKRIIFISLRFQKS